MLNLLIIFDIVNYSENIASASGVAVVSLFRKRIVIQKL